MGPCLENTMSSWMKPPSPTAGWITLQQTLSDGAWMSTHWVWTSPERAEQSWASLESPGAGWRKQLLSPGALDAVPGRNPGTQGYCSLVSCWTLTGIENTNLKLIRVSLHSPCSLWDCKASTLLVTQSCAKAEADPGCKWGNECREVLSCIVTADMLEELDKLWPRKGLDTLQLVFFAVVLIYHQG